MILKELILAVREIIHKNLDFDQIKSNQKLENEFLQH